MWSILRWLDVALGIIAIAGLITETRCYWRSVLCPKEKWNLAVLYILVASFLSYSIIMFIDTETEKAFSIIMIPLMVAVCVRNTIDYPKWTLVDNRIEEIEGDSTRIAT